MEIVGLCRVNKSLFFNWLDYETTCIFNFNVIQACNNAINMNFY